MSKNDGGPAFPNEFGCGMTLRDWYAGMALQGELANSGEEPWSDDNELMCARRCYAFADAMLKIKEEL